MNSGTSFDCGCCIVGRILVDGNTRSGTTSANLPLYRYWGQLLQTLMDHTSINVQVDFYPDVAGGNFDLDDYKTVHLILPESDPDWLADLAGSTVQRVVIYGDADGNSDAPYDYGTAVKDEVNTLMSGFGSSLSVLADVNTNADTIESTPLMSGVTSLVSGASSNLDGDPMTGAVADAVSSADGATIGDETVDGKSYVLMGTPSYIFYDSDPGDDVNLPFYENLWNVAP